MQFDSLKEAGEYLKNNYNLDSYLNYFLESAKDNKSFVCPSCGHGSRNSKRGLEKIPNSDLYKCFNCGLSGDIFHLLHESRKINYTESVRQIAEWVNFDFTIRKQGELMAMFQDDKKVKNESLKADDQEAIKARNKQIIEKSQANFTEDSKASDYLKSRGLYFDICKKYGIGYNTKYNSVIIPTTEDSFVFRSIDENAKISKGNSKGKQSIFNIGLLEKMKDDVLSIYENKLFICEGWADSLSLLQSGFQAVALNSTQNINMFIDKIKSFDDEQKELLKADSFLLALDRDKAGREATEILMQELQEMGFTKIFDVSNFIITTGKDINEAYIKDREQVEKKANEIYKNPNTDILKRLYEDGNSSINCLNDFLNSFEKPKKAISTGFKSLDSVLYGGFFTGLYILGAVSSLGKTSLALQIASNIAERGQDVLFFSLEMSKRELLAKIISRFTFDINRDSARNTIEILNNFLDKEDQAKAIRQRENRDRAFDRLKGFANRIFIFEGIGNITAEQIRNKIEEHIKITGNTPFVLIDYVQIIAPIDFKMTDKQATDRNITELKRISRDFNCVILGISSFNRESYKEEVSLTSFKESGAIEYGSDVLLGLQYKALEKEEKFGKIESEKDYNTRKAIFYKELEEKRSKGEFLPLQVKILKNRNGRIGKTDIYFKPPYNYFTDNVDFTKNDFESPFDL